MSNRTIGDDAHIHYANAGCTVMRPWVYSRPEDAWRCIDQVIRNVAHGRLFRTDQFGLTTFLLSPNGHIATSNP